MLSNKYFKPVLLGLVVIFSLIAGLSFIYYSTPAQNSWQSYIPEIASVHKPISSIIVFNESNYDAGLSITLRSLQAIINSQLPDGTALFLINKPQDRVILNQLYAKNSTFSIYQFPTGNSSLTTLANLINYFKGIIKGYILFNETAKIYYPGIINFLANYENSIAIPYPMFNVLPSNFTFLQMYNFMNQTNTTTKVNIEHFYQNQINSFQGSLQGVNIWKVESDNEGYFDYVINKKYFTFPSELLNGSYPTLQQSIGNLIKINSHKPLLNSWPATIPRLAVPIYRNISDISNLSLLNQPFLFTKPFEQVFQELLMNNEETQITNKPQGTNDFNYSLIINCENNTLNFLYNFVLPVLAINSTLLNNYTIAIDDSSFVLMPDLFYWLLTTHPSIHFIPKIVLGKTIEPVYFPSLFSNQTAFVEGNIAQNFSSEWTSESYTKVLDDHFSGLYSSYLDNISSLFNLKVKQALPIDHIPDNAESFFLSYLQIIIQKNSSKNFVLLFTGNVDFLSNAIFNFKFALEKTELTMNSLFICYSASQLFNNLK